MINVGLIPKSDKVEIKYFNNGDTNDIIKIVLKGVNAPVKRGFDSFAKQFDKSKAGLRNLWSFVKYDIVYQVDPDGQQDILLPSALWERGYGDCKSKTVFICHVLKCLNIPFVIRFTSYTKGDLAHVYPVAIFNNEEIIIDSVFDFFDREKTYIKKKDYDMTKISMISGIGQSRGKNPKKDLDTTGIAKEYVDIVLHKRSIVRPPSEQVPLTSTIAEANAWALRRNLQLQETFAYDNPRKKADIQKAIQTLDSAIKEGINRTKVSGIGSVGSVEGSVINIINNYLKDTRPATDFTRTTGFSKIASKKISGDFDYDNITFYDPTRKAMGTLTGNTAIKLNEKDFSYGGSSRHKVSYKVGAIAMINYLMTNPNKFKIVVQNKQKTKFSELGQVSNYFNTLNLNYDTAVDSPNGVAYNQWMSKTLSPYATNIQDIYGGGQKSWMMQNDNNQVRWYDSNWNNISTQNRIKKTIQVATQDWNYTYTNLDLNNAVALMA